MAKSFLALLVGAIVASASASAVAQTATAPAVVLDRFSPSDAGAGWFALDNLDFSGDRRWLASVITDHAHRPLVVRSATDGSTEDVVSDQFQVHLQSAMVFMDKLRVGLSLPLVLLESGERTMVRGIEYPEPGAGVGDPRLGATLRVFGQPGGAIVGAAGLHADIPWHLGGRRYGREDDLRLSPHFAIAGRQQRLSFAARAGLRAHLPRQLESELPRGTDAEVSVAAGVRFWREQVLVGPELYGATMLDGDGPFTKRSSPLEVLLGGHYRNANGFGAGIGVCAGVVSATGTPPLRVLANFNFITPVR